MNTPVVVGFTNDGKVFMSMMVQGPSGEPGKVTLDWSPKEASQVADWLTTAANHAGNPIITPGGEG